MADLKTLRAYEHTYLTDNDNQIDLVKLKKTDLVKLKKNALTTVIQDEANQKGLVWRSTELLTKPTLKKM